ncbi:MAG: hypothetical protein RMJ56_00015 [Gemmataceae bacterium]|nr:hypothetical protein [Gemmata sp.]MDW8195965.1 hypothetical protein [Gemmataceae bacterium]
MRQIFSLSALLLGSWLLTSFAADKDKYQSKAGKFAIQFPAGEKVVTDTKKAGGNIDMHFAVVEKNGQTYIAMYMDLPEAAKEVPSKTILDGAEKGSVSQGGGKVESSKDIEFGKEKLPGREFVTDKDGTKVKTRVIIHKTRVYIIVVGGSNDFITREGTKFLDSFEITE